MVSHLQARGSRRPNLPGRIPGGADERERVRHVFVVFLAYLLFIFAGIAYFLVIGLRHL
jgi:hypothetical protein